MKTSINFYSEDLKPKKEYLTLNSIGIAALVASALMLVWFGLLTMKIEKIKQQETLLSQDMGYAQQELSTLQQALIKHNDSSNLIKHKQQLQHQIRAKQALLSSVSVRTDAIDFYRVMKELTEHHEHDLWLTNFTFNHKAVMFNGYATQSKAVTQWLSYLQNTSSFKGREFSHLNIQAFDDKILSFQAATSVNSLVEEAP